MRSIPTLIVPFRMIRTEYFVLRTLPAITSFDPIVLVESNRRNLLRLWLCTKGRVLRFDLLHLLRVRLLHRAHPYGPLILLAGWRSCTGFSHRLFYTLFPLLNLLLSAMRRHFRRTA